MVNKEAFKENNYTGVVSEFLGFIKGVEFNNKTVFISTEYIMDIIKEMFNTKIPKELISAYKDALERTRMKAEYFSLSELEEEVIDVINNNFKDLEYTTYKHMTPFYEEFVKWSKSLS